MSGNDPQSRQEQPPVVPPMSEAGTETLHPSVQITPLPEALMHSDVEATHATLHADLLKQTDWLGARVVRDGCLFRVWAPVATSVRVLVESSRTLVQQLFAQADGYFTGFVAEVRAGYLYRYVLDDGKPLPDPCSRYQPQGPHGPSMVIDPNEYTWATHDWNGIHLQGQVIYELHIGTFTDKGTFDAAADKLEYLRALGVTLIEVMPVAECPGRWNWGYDGVSLFAPSHHYGDYAAMQRFVDRAHALGLGVILDVVYNHLGPDGNYLPSYSPDYFSQRHTTEWGQPLNFDGENSAPVREFMLQNACDWIRHFRLDGLRLDATQSIFDDSELPILAELSQRVRAAAGSRHIVIISENEPQHATQLSPVDEGGCDVDGMWNDDFHHSAMVAATGRRHAYYLDYRGTPQEFVSAAKYGFLFQGQYFSWQRQARGEPLTTPLYSCIHFLENHDQVANSLTGERLHQLTSPARYRALTALLLLGPQTPMLFMGQEFAASSPFLFFADHVAPLNEAVYKGRKEFLSQFPGASITSGQQQIPDPAHDSTLQRSRLRWEELNEHTEVLSLHVDLLALRRHDPVIAAQGEHGIDGAVLAEQAFLLRWFDADNGDRLLVINLGNAVMRQPFAEPLLAPPPRMHWVMCWSSEHIRYGGMGEENPLNEDFSAELLDEVTRRSAPHQAADPGWHLPAECAVLFKAVPLDEGANLNGQVSMRDHRCVTIDASGSTYEPHEY